MCVGYNGVIPNVAQNKVSFGVHMRVCDFTIHQLKKKLRYISTSNFKIDFENIAVTETIFIKVK